MKRLRWGLAIVVVALAGLFARSLWRAHRGLHPARLPVDQPRPSAAEDVSFRTSDGLLLRGWFVPPKNAATVILGHGHGVNRTQLLPEARALIAEGFGVLLFDWRAHGESEGALVSFGFFEQNDLKAAIDFVAARKDVDPGRIGALGFSRGGTVLLEVAARDPRIKAVIVESTNTSMREGVCRDFGGRPFGCVPTVWMFAMQGIELDAVRAVERICAIAPRPVLVVHGAGDLSTPVEVGRRLAAAACEPKEYWEIPRAGHGEFATFEPEEYPRRIVEFFERGL